MKDYKNVLDFLNIYFPNDDRILVGCHASKTIDSYECCEYDLVIIHDENNLDNKKINSNSIQYFQYNDLRLKVLYLNRKNFFENMKINYLRYIKLDRHSSLKNLSNDYHEEKKENNIKNFKVIKKKDAIKNALELTRISRYLKNNESSKGLYSYYLRIIALDTLGLLIKLHLNEYPSSSHVKYQIKMIREKNMKIREWIDFLQEYIGIERSNISIMNRSEKSLRFLFRECIQKNEFKLLLEKLSFFNKNSMYVDGYLLINYYIKDQNFEINFVINYNKLLNYVLDVQNREKLTMLKEAETLFSINRSSIKNNY